jgi:hypothetical protein
MNEPRRETEPRRKSDVAAIVSLLTVVFQLGGVVWYASRVDAVVEHLREVVVELRKSDSEKASVIANHDGRLRVLEVQRAEDVRRLENVERQLDGPETH